MFLFICLVSLIAVAAALDPSCSPGGNFDLTRWNLQLPTGSTGKPTTIAAGELQSCSGYSSSYFYTDGSNGDLVMKVPGSPSSAGCVTTPNSLHCRTELREINPSKWSPLQGVNRMRVELAVIKADDSNHGTVVGQIHIDDSISSKPVCELYYSSSGVLSMGVEHTRAGGDSDFTPLATIPLGQRFTYEIRYEGGQLSASVNDGAFVQLDQFELANPESYFKVGNYNQGDSASEVHLHSISVSHGSKAATSAHAVSTISQGGIGPFETLYVLDHTVTPYPSPTGACGPSPTKYSDGTVNLGLYYEDNCCHDVETAHIGQFNVCHNTDGPFSSLKQAVGKNLFDRGIHIMAYTGLDCTGGSASGLSLSNTKGCQGVASGDAGYQSFMLEQPPSCSVKTKNKSKTTVTLDLYSQFGCCDSIETIKVGNIGTCHDANKPFHSLSQAVGSDMFGWLYHIHPYAGTGCSGEAGDKISLSNNKHCTQHGTAWKSFRISQDCRHITPDIASDTTVTLALYRDGNCCVPTIEKISLGNLDECHTPDAKFGSITQAVGKGMFGRRIYIQAFEGAGCTGEMRQVSLTNSDSCDLEAAPETYASFRLHIKPPPCGYVQPANSNANTVELAMYSDAGCCVLEGTTTVGTLDKCHNVPDGQFQTFNLNAGSSLISEGAWLYLYSQADCAGSAVGGALSKDLLTGCYYSNGGNVKSYKLVVPDTSSGSGSSTPPALPAPNPPSGPTSSGCVTAHCYEETNNLLFEDTMTIQIYKDGKYILILQNIIKNAGSNTQWTWSGVRDPDGIVWDFQVGGDCGEIQYQNSAQASKGWIGLDQSRREGVTDCDVSTRTAKCLEYESSSWDDDTCATGANPPFCDWKSRCDPFYPGTPITCGGSTC
ncbi:alginate lyase-domain-containing protein [Aspergillus carlsbadensis]|nr:alginate lyase-domain-containing protein [Aspergillus carlsbadensis]